MNDAAADPPAESPADPPAESPAGPPERPADITHTMMKHAEDAIAHAQSTFGVELDRSPGSIALLEAVAHTIHKLIEDGDELSEAEYDVLCKIYGGYLGEVLRAELGGKWLLDTEVSPGVGVIALRFSAGRIYPPMKWSRRLEKGVEEDLVAFAAMVRERESAGESSAPARQVPPSGSPPGTSP